MSPLTISNERIQFILSVSRLKGRREGKKGYRFSHRKNPTEVPKSLAPLSKVGGGVHVTTS